MTSNGHNAGQRDFMLRMVLSFSVMVGLILLFVPHFGELLKVWTRNTSYTHGPLIPFVFAYLVWDKKKELAELEIIPSFKGGLTALVVVSALWLIAVGGKSRFAIEVCFILLIISAVWFNYGSLIARKLSFPLFLLFMMIPLPEVLYGSISRKLQLLSSQFGVAFMQLLSVPVYREGNIIYLPETTLQVAEACSGISSLISLFTLAMIYAYLTQRGMIRRFLLVLSAFPVAIFMNWVRIAATGMIAHYWSLKYAQGFYHSFSGWIVFVFAFFIFLGIGKLFSYIPRHSDLPETRQ